MAERKDKVWTVRTKEGAQTAFYRDGDHAPARLIRAKSEAQVNAHIAKDYDITLASHDDVHALGKQNIEIENAVESDEPIL